ncbi:polysaccharide lyase family 1 protein [Aaosphaeria arxii CBS 175.79]|uniref:pectate lyase n=1 Tax=Aaosphaeria arxii CBS 175.79 TaxID=1450172 RepID=A0A6A5XTY4_9PLEO|nr:polysaccharide lyase family 1 protein [Aaosphaeria arxii CBS 175.79]KAF2016413.1 polysaccharide lyase family 1 protein [Aaosphaeria arxii CBS 175.79]
MKLSSILTLGLPALALAAPTFKRASLIKRANLDEVATTGYATENGGTSGGKGGKTVEVSSFDELTAAVKGDEASIILITGPIKATGDVRVGSNKSIIGKDSSVKLEGFTITVKQTSNVILRNFALSKVVGGDSISLNKATNVWVDHVDLFSDRDHDKDYYDGLLDITHASDFVTVSNSFLHDHWKATLVGHSNSNESEDKGKLHITYNNNYFKNLNSRVPSFRFGTGHIYNNFYEDVSDGINTRLGAQLLVENNAFSGIKKPLYATDAGFAVARGNDFGGVEVKDLGGSLDSVPYKADLIEASAVKAAVVGTAGVTLTF